MFLYIRDVYNPDMEYGVIETAPKKAMYFIDDSLIYPSITETQM